MKEPNIENKKAEETAEERLANLLKEKGIENQEAKSLLDAWTREQEKRVEQSDDPLLEAIKFNLRRGRLYLESGYIEEALEVFDDTLIQAENEDRTELSQLIREEIGNIEKTLE